MSDPNPDRHSGEHNLPDLTTSRWAIEVHLRRDQPPLKCYQAFSAAKRRGDIASAHGIDSATLEVGLEMEDDETAIQALHRFLKAIPNHFIKSCKTPKICAEFD